MSRIGRQPIIIPAGVTVKIDGRRAVMVSGPRGQLNFIVPPGVEIKVGDGKVVCEVSKTASKQNLNNWGLSRTLIANAINGVTQQWTKILELVGVGFRASVENDELVLNIGFSHPVRVKAPVGVSFAVFENKIKVTGCDKQLVGEAAARLRRIRPPEPYKGKGIKYQEEKIVKKVGKVAKAIGQAQLGGGKS